MFFNLERSFGLERRAKIKKSKPAFQGFLFDFGLKQAKIDIKWPKTG